MKYAIILLIILFTSTLLTADTQEKTTYKSRIRIKNTGKPIVIPFQMINNKPVFQCKLNGKDISMTIDNGVLWDQLWFFGSKTIENMKLKAVGEGSVEGAGEEAPIQAYETRGLKLSFPEVDFLDETALISMASDGFSEMFPGIDGQVSNTFFMNFIVQFDFEKKQIILHPIESFKVPENYQKIPIYRGEKGSYAVDMEIILKNGKTLHDKIDLDIGGIHTLFLGIDEQKGIDIPSDSKKQIIGYGAQGPINGWAGKVKQMKIGKFVFDNDDIVFSQRNSMLMDKNSIGVMGLPFMQRFDIIFDYPHQCLYLCDKSR